MILHNYFRSSTSVRLRVALNLKGLAYDYVSYALQKQEQSAPDFLARNPQGLVPALELEDGAVLHQSLAIIEWLDETHPDPALLPSDPMLRAKARAYAYMIACEIHPLNNLRVLNTLRSEFGADDAAVAAWFRKWVETTFTPLEKMLAEAPETGTFCMGETPTLPDLCLYAQVWNNKRFQVDMAPFPTISRIFDACDALEAFAKAAPPVQPDAF
ncbi:maleylacetoacetate isomerase [Rhodovulum sp. DZ06]|uniref:maleylacetoacetate isomerase n=1 Tax=Rhodovulum sp. DZ06 TaxID=3425126 RepID=UPI003D3465CA